MAMENGPFEDVFPIKHGGFPFFHVSLPDGGSKICLISWGDGPI